MTKNELTLRAWECIVLSAVFTRKNILTHNAQIHAVICENALNCKNEVYHDTATAQRGQITNSVGWNKWWMLLRFSAQRYNLLTASWLNMACYSCPSRSFVQISDFLHKTAWHVHVFLLANLYKNRYVTRPIHRILCKASLRPCPNMHFSMTSLCRKCYSNGALTHQRLRRLVAIPTTLHVITLAIITIRHRWKHCSENMIFAIFDMTFNRP